MKTLTFSSKTLHRFCRTCLVQLDASSCRAKYNFRELKISQLVIDVASAATTPLEREQKQMNTAVEEEKEEAVKEEQKIAQHCLPKFLCQQCYEKLHSFNDFRAMSLRSAQKCRELLATAARREQQLQAAVAKLETHVAEEEGAEQQQQLVALEHEQVLNEIYGNRDWLEFDGDYGNKSPPVQQKQAKLKKFSRRISKRKMETHSETSAQEVADARKRVMSSLLDNEVFFSEPPSSLSFTNHKQEKDAILVDGMQLQMETVLQENKFEFLDSAVIIKQRDILEDNETNDATEDQQATTEGEELENSSTHDSDAEYDAGFEMESANEESNESENLREMKTQFKRITLPAAPANSLSSMSTPSAVDTSNITTNTTKATSSVGDSKKLQCEHCPHRFKSLANLDAHMRTHQGLKAFQCGECTRSFSKAYGLRLHMREQHTDEGLQTEITCAYEGCGKLFRRLSTYKAHYRVKHTRDLAANPRPSPKTFVCEVCGRTFKNMTTLKEHRYKHSPAEEYPYQCADCGKRYTSPRVYKEHLMRHAGIKDYVCPHCGMRKTTRNELRTHINYHTKERQWPCPHCPSVFNNSANLGMHDRVVHKGIRRYACRHCELTFGKPDTLKHHEMRHTGERPHKCQLCGKGFIQIVALRAHMKTHNKNNGTGAGGGGDAVGVSKPPAEMVETLVHHDQRREMASACLQLVKDLTELHDA